MKLDYLLRGGAIGSNNIINYWANESFINRRLLVEINGFTVHSQ